MALLDFDVHHGNGTQACIRNTAPSLTTHRFETPYSKGLQEFPVWKPWLDSSDPENIFFARFATLLRILHLLDVCAQLLLSLSCRARRLSSCGYLKAGLTRKRFVLQHSRGREVC